jgi:acetylornithine deacetylase/succinyl-diaminopimelate desuccinylase-like protein
MSVSFEEFIIQCCKAQESSLRKWMRKVLPRYNFTIKEDDYVSERAKKNDAYKDVHNLIAVRGNPKVCLVAHTDVCRDHDRHDNAPIYYGNPKKKPANAKMVEPVIKRVEVEEEDSKTIKRIIQDKNIETQVGGDDRVGVAINLWIALNTGYDMALYFPTDEEVGLRSAREVDFAELREYDLCVEVDRGNHSHELVTKINSTILCDYDTVVRLLEIAYDMGRPRKAVTGANTDVYALKERKIIKNAVNMTCGYHASVSSSPNEYIDIEESRDTMKYVANIVKDYNIKP